MYRIPLCCLSYLLLFLPLPIAFNFPFDYSIANEIQPGTVGTGTGVATEATRRNGDDEGGCSFHIQVSGWAGRAVRWIIKLQ